MGSDSSSGTVVNERFRCWPSTVLTRMRMSQGFTGRPRWKFWIPRQANRKASCTCSSACAAFPVIR